MAKKYKLKSLSVQIGGIVYRKEEGVVFDVSGKLKALKPEIEAAFKAGFLVELTKKEEENERLVQEKAKKEAEKVKKAAEKERKEKAEAAEAIAEKERKEKAKKAEEAAEEEAKKKAADKKAEEEAKKAAEEAAKKNK